MHTARNMLRRYRVPSNWIALVLSFGLSLMQTTWAQAATLDRIRQTSTVTFGYRADERPFSFMEKGAGAPIGYSIVLCEAVVDAIRTELGVSELAIKWVPVTIEDGFTAVEQGNVDLLCASSSVSLEARKQVSFSIPIYPGGIAALIRSDAPMPLQDVLLGRPPTGPIWRASPAQILTGKTFSIVSGTSGEPWLSERLDNFHLSAVIAPVESYGAGVLKVLDRASDVLFGERPILIEAAAGSPAPSDLIVLDKMFTTAPVAFALARNDDEFRLVVDRALSRFFPSTEFRDLYTKWFGAPDDAIVTFIRQSALPE
jgi:polar amino acid transport system substrate-binding protein